MPDIPGVASFIDGFASTGSNRSGLAVGPSVAVGLEGLLGELVAGGGRLAQLATPTVKSDVKIEREIEFIALKSSGRTLERP